MGSKVRSAYHMLSLLFLPPGAEDFPCSSMGNLPEDTILRQELWCRALQGLPGVICFPVDFHGLQGPSPWGCRVFFPLPKYIIPEVLPPLVMALAISGSALEPASIGSIRHRETSGSFSQKTPLSPSPVPKPAHANLGH